MYSLAAAPISWGICDVPGWGVQLDAGRVFAEMRSLGITATEIGPLGFLPEDPREARRVLDEAGMRAVGSYEGLALHRDGWKDALRAAAKPIVELGGNTLVFAVLAGPGDYSGDPGLSDADRQRILAALNEIATLEDELGLTLAVHPHLGTLIETPDEIDWMLESSAVRVCLDTGHAYAAGCDVVDVLERIGPRLAHVHLKDADDELSRRLRAGKVDFLEAVRQGIFRSLGRGALDVSRIVTALRGIDYTGWLVLEQDIMLDAEPEPGTGPVERVKESIAALRGAEKY